MGEFQQKRFVSFQQSGLHGDQQQGCSLALPMPLEQMQLVDDAFDQLSRVMAEKERALLQHCRQKSQLLFALAIEASRHRRLRSQWWVAAETKGVVSANLA